MEIFKSQILRGKDRELFSALTCTVCVDKCKAMPPKRNREEKSLASQKTGVRKSRKLNKGDKKGQKVNLLKILLIYVVGCLLYFDITATCRLHAV